MAFQDEQAGLQGEITVRVRYAETDRMGLLHHANYLVYFEQGRTELLRSCGLAYKDLEDRGYLLVIARMEIRYRSPARYDDLLTVRTTVVRTTRVRIDHRYEVFRDRLLLAEGSSTLACVDRDGRLREMPEELIVPGGEIRNSKSEIRNKPEIRNPKS